MARLLFYRGSQHLLDYKLRPGRTTVGRADACDVALPGEELSRTHCIVEGQGDTWEIIDRSRHGTKVNGVPVRRAALTDQAQVEFGPYTMSFRMRDKQDSIGPTAEALPERNHELVMAAGESGLRVERAVLVVVSGPDQGSRMELKSSTASVGASPSSLPLTDLALVPDHCRLRVSRGRVLIEPGAGPVFLDGAQVRDITPLYTNEEFHLGNTVLRVEVGESEEAPMAAVFGDMVGESAAMKKLFGMLRRVSVHHFPVLLTGESGTGKELAARGIHDHSRRAANPFVPINAGAIPQALFESELFGYERGAFTGANKRTDGAFQRAHGGTLFLDEIGELPDTAQSKLLRVLESGEVRRVGATDVEYPDVRIVAATNRDLSRDVRAGKFREDLFFRLAVLQVHIPPLRGRLGDLDALCVAICRGLHPDARVSDEALQRLKAHSWPGNVRELRNVLTRAYVLGGPTITPDTLSFHTLGAPTISAELPVGEDDEAERAYLIEVLKRHGDNRSAVARELGLARSTLNSKMRRYGLGS